MKDEETHIPTEMLAGIAETGGEFNEVVRALLGVEGPPKALVNSCS